MVKIVCPNCAADLDVPNAPIHTCEYCGTAIQVSQMVGPEGKNITGEKVTEEAKNTYVFKEHFIIRSQYNGSQAQNLMEDWIVKIPGAPQDFESTATITERKLKFYPIWVGEYKSSSQYAGLDNWPSFSKPAFDRPGWYEYVSYYKKEERGTVHREYQIPLLALHKTKIPKYLRDYNITTTGKEYFDIQHVKELGGDIIDSVFSLNEAKQTMYQGVIQRQNSEIYKEVTQITSRNDNIEERGVYYIHFPVYEFKFTYGKKQYEAFIDGSNGRIIHIDVPISTRFRVITLSVGGAHAAAGTGLLISGLSVPSIAFFGIAAGIGILATGLVFILLNFRRGAREKQT
ncbi:MAG: hypothetical protein GF364_07875 [Candidatus Lokiarchaeota archaeon]|nr:hypothetical protein [Candidatus Lokiarchaeota archaeon]